MEEDQGMDGAGQMIPDTLRQIMPAAGVRADTYAPILTEHMPEYFIDSPKRIAAFLAQVAHECAQLVYTAEIASGAAYEGRADLGNIHPGDGVKYKGRGLVQITGRANYTALTSALGIDLVNNPEQLEQPKYAVISACWFWKTHNLNQYADTDKFGALTKAINGGYNGLDDRIQFWLRARKALGVI